MAQGSVGGACTSISAGGAHSGGLLLGAAVVAVLLWRTWRKAQWVEAVRMAWGGCWALRWWRYCRGICGAECHLQGTPEAGRQCRLCLLSA